MLLKFIYTVFIGILLALFVGLGIAAFYEKPKIPDYPAPLKYTAPINPDTPKDTTNSAKMEKEQQRYDSDFKTYQQKSEEYNRNVSILTLIASIIILVISLTIFKNLPLISDGLLLGGIFVLLYSIVRGFQSDNDKFRFIVVAIGLVIALILGYLKFIKPTKTK